MKNGSQSNNLLSPALHKMNGDIVSTSHKYLSLKETSGPKTNSFIAEWFKLVNLPGADDSKVPWCAVFVAGVLAECRILGTGSALARSYLQWGTSCRDEPIPGDIVVLTRGEDPGAGHVGFFLQFSANRKSILIRSGNIDNMVADEWFAADRLVDIRRVSPPILV